MEPQKRSQDERFDGSFRGVGSKVGSFLGHKFFHPTNHKNLKAIRKAEELEELRLLRQKEKIAERQEEIELQRFTKDNQAMRLLLPRDKKIQAPSTLKQEPELEGGLVKPEVLAKLQEEYKKIEKEEILNHSHSSIFGSYYCLEKKRWGYSCCKEVGRSKICKCKSTKTDKIKN